MPRLGSLLPGSQQRDEIGHAFGARGGGARRRSSAPERPTAAPDPKLAAEPPVLLPTDGPVPAIIARLSELESLPGFLGACLAEGATGFLVAGHGDRFDAEGLAVLAAQFVHTETHVIQTLHLDDSLDEILLTLGTRVHLVQPLGGASGLIVHLVLDRARANPALARMRLRALAPLPSASSPT